MKESLFKGDVLNVDLTIVFRNLNHDCVVLDVDSFLKKVIDLCNVTLNGILEVSKK